METGQQVEDPVVHLQRIIRDRFWHNLTRRLDVEVISQATDDTKRRRGAPARRLYVPSHADDQLAHYKRLAQENQHLQLIVEKLPHRLTSKEYLALNEKPGLLSLDMEELVNPTTGEKELRGVSFVVPGGWFNEFFGWDSYFMSLGLLIDGRVDLVKNVIRNWIFEIQHYGLIPNANRSYLMLRSQPPFLTDLCLRLYKHTADTDPGAKNFLKRGIDAAIKEYHSTWMSHPRLDDQTGLSKYCPNGFGIPPEVDLKFFAPVLDPYAEKYGLSREEFAERFNTGDIDEPELQTYFLHDRALRESGHDTQNRLEGKTADLAIIDLNCLLYKFETDIAYAIREVFRDDFEVSKDFRMPTSDEDNRSTTWDLRAKARKAAMDKYLWNAERGIYVDWNTRTKQQEPAESVTCLWALWCGVASEYQAQRLVECAIPLFEQVGGLSSSSRATGFMNRRREYQSQWDFPHGWAPHQIMAWDGLARYGFDVEAERLAYRWLLTILKVAVERRGAVLEKYDVTKTVDPHLVVTEYANQGLGFVGEAQEGFGWTNASFTYGLRFLTSRLRQTLSTLAPYPDTDKGKL